MAPCEANGCLNERRGLGPYCNLHRQRVRKHGDADWQRYAPLDVRMESRIDRSGACWVWTGARSEGYGQVWDQGRMRLVHRLMFEALVGPIPAGLQLDHLCRNHACCNPAHLEPVTPSENAKRGLNSALRAERSKP